MSDIDPLQMDERLGAAQRGLPDPVSLSRQIAKANASYQRWQDQLRQDPDCEDNPLQPYRTVAGRTLFRDLDQLGEQDPLRDYLKRWVFCLAERRVNSKLTRASYLERYQRKLTVETEPSSLTLAEMLLHALRKPAMAASVLNDYLKQCGPYGTQIGLLWERRAELARRWGLPSYERVLAGSDDAAPVEAARAWLDRTQDMFFEHRQSSLDRLIDSALARDAKLDWPSHLSWRTLAGFFAGTQLLSSLKLRSKRLPERVAPASFMRALARMGEEWSQALAPSDQFFVVAHDPYRLQTHAYAALFAMLLHNPSFLKHTLGMQPHQLAQTRRALFRTLLIESRVRALKVVVANGGLHGRAALQETFLNELDHRLGVRLPEHTAGALFVPDNESERGFAGLLLASSQVDALFQSHNEDWFRNPRAIDQLRSEASLPPRLMVDAASCERGATSLYAKLASALG